MHSIRTLKAMGKESGQIVVMLAVALPLLLIFTGMGIDYGLGYLTKAQLSRAADAASLTAMRNLGQGQATARTLALSVFASNPFLGSNLYASAPSASVTYSTDSYGDPVVNVTASAAIKTYFIRIVGMNTLSVSSASQATRPPVILSLVLDRSGSMGGNGGSTALPVAVKDFLYYFIEGTDQLAETSFASTDKTDVPITITFQTPINSSLAAMSFTGATYAQGGLLDAQAQVNSITPPPNAVKVIVYFTDGQANTVQDKLTGCNSGNKVNFGGYDSGNYWNIWASTDASGSDINNTGSCYPTTFPTTDPALSNPAALSRVNITTEGEYRAVNWANQMRAAGITVYSIGLGNDINKTFLQEVANAPGSPTYNSSSNPGLAEFAPSASDLDTAFQTIASKILLRLTH